MILSDPVPWSYVPVGAVVFFAGAPRTVLVATPGTGGVLSLLLEGLPPGNVLGYRDTVRLVTLDDSDAMTTLAAAGLNPEPIAPEEGT